MMGIKKKIVKLCRYFAAMLAVSAAFFGGLPVPVNNTAMEKVTVWFMAGDGECETESMTVDKGRAVILPEASCEGCIFTGF